MKILPRNPRQVISW